MRIVVANRKDWSLSILAKCFNDKNLLPGGFLRKSSNCQVLKCWRFSQIFSPTKQKFGNAVKNNKNNDAKLSKFLLQPFEFDLRKKYFLDHVKF